MLAGQIGSINSIEDVLSVMRAIDRALPDTDGVKWFNFLYLSVTEAVQAETTGWEDWPFLKRLDVVFATLYFDAIRAGSRIARRRHTRGARCSGHATSQAGRRFSSRSPA